VARWANKVQTSVDTKIGLLLALGLLLLTHVRFMLVVYEFDNREPGVTVVDIVAKARGIDDGQLDLELAFLKLGLDDLNLSELVELLVMTLAVVFGR